MREIRELDRRERCEVYRCVYREAFPPAELRPLASMEQMIAAGEYRMLGLYEDGEALAYASLWQDGRYVLIDYLCVPKDKRSRGSGGELLRRLREVYPPESILFGESEAPTGDPEADGMILRRLAFYQRCGAVTLHYDTALFGVHYKTLAFCDGTPPEAEIMAAHAGFYRRKLPGWIYRRVIRIPYDGGPLPKCEKWEENEDP